MGTIGTNISPRREKAPALPEKAITGFGILISVALAVLLPILASSNSSKVDVALGAAGFVAGYLVTMDAATRARLASMEATLLGRIEAIDKGRYGALPLQNLLAVPEIEQPLVDVVDAAARTSRKPMPFLANRTIERIRHDRDETLRIASGVFRCLNHAEQLRLVRAALSDTRQSLDAVAGLGLNHWRTAEFNEYFDAYLDFADNLTQRRIFLVEPHEMDEPDMIGILETHARAGVETYALDKTRIDVARQQPLVLFDRQLLLAHTRQQSTDGIEVHFTDEELRLRDAGEAFDSLMRLTKRSHHSVMFWPTGETTPATSIKRAS